MSTTVLDTTGGTTVTGDTYLTQVSKDLDSTRHVQVVLSSGDTVVVEGGVDSTTGNFVTLATFTASDLVTIDLPPYWRAKRTVDGGVGEALVYVSGTVRTA